MYARRTWGDGHCGLDSVAEQHLCDNVWWIGLCACHFENVSFGIAGTTKGGGVVAYAKGILSCLRPMGETKFILPMGREIYNQSQKCKKMSY